MRVVVKGTGDPRVRGGAGWGIGGKISEEVRRRWGAWIRWNWGSRNTTLHSFGDASAGLIRELNENSANVLNLHWIAGCLSVADIARLKKPIVWTLHDMWPFCGAEHYAADGPDSRFRVGYEGSNRPKGESGRDFSRQVWLKKRKLWSKQAFTLVGDSNWMARCAKESALFQGMRVSCIHYPIDVHGAWKPVRQKLVRAVLGIPQNVKVVLMGADGGVADPRKGGDLMREAMKALVKTLRASIEVMVFGGERPAGDTEWPCPVRWLGR